MRGCFVTGTDTGVGKTVVAAAIAAALRARGEAVAAFKPVVTGTDEPRDPDWPPDHELLAAAAGGGQAAAASGDAVAGGAASGAGAVTPFTFGPAVSPHLAAELADRPLDPAVLRSAFAAVAARADVVVAEGVGGLMVPLARGCLVLDFARDVGLPLVIAARPGLGTINHTLLTIAAARAAGLRVAGVAITPWPERPSTMEADNRATIARLGEVEVATLPPLPRADPALLAAAGAQLPLDRWSSVHDTVLP